MQTRSINQINGRLKSSPDINFYLQLCEDQSNYKNIGWRERYFNYKFTYDTFPTQITYTHIILLRLIH